MRLPSGSIQRIFLYASGAGIALGLFCYGVLTVLLPTLTMASPIALLFSLALGGLLGGCFFLASRYTLRLAAYDMRHTAADLTGQPAQTFLTHSEADEFATLRAMLTRTVHLFPDHRLHGALAQVIADSPADMSLRFGAVMNRFSEDVPLAGAALCSYNVSQATFQPLCTWGLPIQEDTQFLPADEGLLRRIAREGHEFVLSGAEVRQILVFLGKDESLALPVLCLPLLIANTLQGLLLLISAEGDISWIMQRRELARSLASQLTLAFSEEQLRQQLAAEQRNLQTLIDLANDLTTDLAFEPALERMLRAIATITDSEHGTLLLFDAHEEVRYRIALSQNTFIPLQLVARSVLRSGLAGWALRERKPDIVVDTQRDSRWLPLPGLEGMRSALVVPLFYGDRALGILTLAHRLPQHYNERVLHLASALAAQAAHIIVHEQPKTKNGQYASDNVLMDQNVLSHVPQVIFDEMIRDGSWPTLAQPRIAQAVVLTIGLRNIALASEHLAPDVLINEVLQPFARSVIATVRDQYGYLDHCDANGALAVFGYPQPLGDAAERALVVAQRLQRGLDELRHRWRTGLRCEITFAMGIAAGAIMTGRMSDDPLQGDYLVLGEAVNQAQRLEALARPGETLCNAALAASVKHQALADEGMILEALQPLPIGDGDEQPYRFRQTP